jgi:hypothetical protein
MKDLNAFAAEYMPGAEVSHYMFLGSFVAQLTVEALARAGRDLSPEKIIEVMEAMQGWNGAWIVDNVSYGPDQHGLGASAMYFMKIQDGKFVRLD